MRKTLFILAAVLLGIASALGDEVIPSYYAEPGINPNRDYTNSHFAETVDPFTGSLQHHYVDLFLPGNGGFDLKVIRSYNSLLVNPLNPGAQVTAMGAGWDMHFGRVLTTTDPAHICQYAAGATSTAADPVLELPDGSRQIMTWSGSSTDLISAERWKLVCTASGVTAYSPEGVRYDMNHQMSFGTTGLYKGWITTQITDRNNNTATISYNNDGYGDINTVTTNDGRTLWFSYDSSGASNPRISRVSDSTRSVFYSYQTVQGYSGVYNLTRVQRPDGSTWDYSYNGNLNFPTSPGSYLMNRVSNPQGGTINYSYRIVNFLPTGVLGAQPNNVVSQKSDSIGGSWSYSYSPSGSGNDQTVESGPAGTVTYEHCGYGCISVGTAWQFGLLLSKNIGSVRTETYTWNPQNISPTKLTRPGSYWSKWDNSTNAPVLASKTITQDGSNYTTSYGSPDSYGNPTRMTESGPGGSRTTSLSYYTDTSKWIVKQIKDENSSGISTLRSFDGNGNISSQTRANRTTSYDYDGEGNVTSMVLPGRRNYNYSGHYRGIPQSESQPDGVTLSRSVSSDGNVLSETNGEGHTTHYSYDDLGRVLAISYPTGNGVSISYGTTTKSATRGGLTEYTAYDGFGHPLSITLGGVARTFLYDGAGRKTYESYPGSSRGTTYQRDILNRVTGLSNGDGSSRSYHYGAGAMSVTDERSKSTSYAYRSYGNPDEQYLMGITAPESNASLTLSRDAHELVTQAIQGGVNRNYNYDGSDYLTQVSNPETGTTTYGRDGAGNMTSRTVGSSGTSSYTYDGHNRVTDIVYPGTTPTVALTYTATNKLASVSSSAATRSYSYDGNDNLTGETLTVDGHVFSTRYGYDGNDHLASLTYPRSNKVVNYSPDLMGRPTQASGYVTNATYWPSGQIDQIGYANNTRATYGQNTRQWPSSLAIDTSTGTLVNSTYNYDGAGNLTSINDSADNRYNRTLGYDGVNRLNTASGPWGNGSITYDGSGNIQRKTFGATDLQYNYSNNRLTSVGGARSANYSYDAYGDIVSDGHSSYNYDGAPNLRCANCNGGAHHVDYSYDGLNQRVTFGRSYGSKGGIKTYEIYGAHGKLLAEYTPNLSNKLVEHIYLGDKRIAQRVTSSTASETVTYYHDDVAGTPLVATDGTGKLLWKENYQPFGAKINNAAPSGTNDVGYAGKPFDDNTGLSYMGARYYDPLLGRFTGIDPKEVDPGDIHSFNRYAYANNNPNKFVDPDGRSPLLVLLAVGLIANEIATSDVPMIGGGLGKAGMTAAERLAANETVGKIGEAITRAELGAEKIAGEQITFITSTGTRTVADFVTRVGESLGIVETKTGNATLSAGQKQLKQDVENGVKVTPVGQKAKNAGLEPGKPTTIDSHTTDRIKVRGSAGGGE